MSRAKGRNRRSGGIRIIGGQWRGRRLPVPELPGLRPTPDRVRETLFNWLSPRISGAVCLDAFAGTGALGIEALSRGAAHCDFVESNRTLARALQEHLQRLDAGSSGRVVQGNWPQALPDNGGQYDLVFLDPPFGQDLLAPALSAVRSKLKSEHQIYVECPPDEFESLTADHRVVRSSQAGQVCFGLLHFEA